MKHTPKAARYLLGLIFFVFGLNGFLNFMPQPELPAEAGMFMGALAATGYFFPVLKATEVICGALLLSGFYVPLALVILAPITLHIFIFHAVMAPGGVVVGIVVVALNAFLGYTYRNAFKSVLAQKTQPKGI